MRRVVLESRLAAFGIRTVADHVRYTRFALRDCLLRGEAPFASHLIYPQALDDLVPEERTRGIEAGLAWGVAAEAVVVYDDLGISGGMKIGIERAASRGLVIEHRRLPPEMLTAWQRGEDPY